MFYETLQVDDAAKHDLPVEFGDCNAKVLHEEQYERAVGKHTQMPVRWNAESCVK